MEEAKSGETAAVLSEIRAAYRRELATPGRIKAAIARARAAGVTGLEAYDAAWVAKSLQQAECDDVVEAFVESEITARIDAARVAGSPPLEIRQLGATSSATEGYMVFLGS